MAQLNRIMITGRPGGGKSTFSFWLHEKLQLPLYHLDRYYFQENWVERNYDEFMQIQTELVSRDSWIIDGVQVRSLEVRYARADVCCYFDFPRWQCMWRIFKRQFIKDVRIQDRAEGCSEILSWKLIVYTWKFGHKIGNTMEKLQEKYPAVRFYRVRSAYELQQLKEKL